jgi:hypothetical protein
MVGMAAQTVGDGLCHTCLVIYPTGNLEGRYRRDGENADDYARGARQWAPRGPPPASAKALEQPGSFDLGDHSLYFRARDGAA